MAWKLKGCPRCGGDIYITQDGKGWNMECLQCSYSRSESFAPQTTKDTEVMPIKTRNRKTSLVGAARSS